MSDWADALLELQHGCKTWNFSRSGRPMQEASYFLTAPCDRCFNSGVSHPWKYLNVCTRSLTTSIVYRRAGVSYLGRWSSSSNPCPQNGLLECARSTVNGIQRLLSSIRKDCKILKIKLELHAIHSQVNHALLPFSFLVQPKAVALVFISLMGLGPDILEKFIQIPEAVPST